MGKLPHILIMSSWYPTKRNPFLGNFVKRHAELIAAKYQVTVLNIEANSSISKISIEKIEKGNLQEIFIEYPSSSNPFIKWLRARKAFEIGVKEIKSVDIIHASNILSKGYQFLWAKKHFQKPLIITEHGSYYRPEVSSNWSWKEKQLINRTFRQASLITAVSPFLKSEIEAVFPKLKIEVLPNVVDHQVFNYKEKESSTKIKFIHISTLDERFKNISGIVEACEIVSREVDANRFELEIVSDESYEKWENIVSKKGLQNFIRFSGPLQPMEIASKIQDSDALILFSNYETFSIVLAEAWATGTPVITTSVGIGKDLPKTLGIQVKARDVEDLKNAMHSFIARSSEFEVSEMLEKAKSYNQGNVLKTIDKIYNRFI